MWTVLAILLWADIVLLALTYAGYPAALVLWARLRPRRPGGSGGETSPLTLVISLHDEVVVIEEKLQNSLDLEGVPRLVLADDGSADGSEEICRGAAAAQPERVCHVAVIRGGKNRTLNCALEEISEGIVVFSDANAMYERDALQRLVEAFSDPAVGCVVGQLCYHAGGETLEGAYWRYENRVKQAESDVGSMVVGNGTIIAARRSLVPALLPGVANDLQIPLAVARAGYRTVFRPDAVAREHMSDTHGEEYARKVRMATRGLSHAGEMFRLAPGVLKLQFLVHKVMRWLTGVALLEVLLLSVFLALGRGGAWHWLLGGQVAGYALAALGAAGERRGIRIPGTRFARYFTVMHLAGLHATWRVLCGETVDVWDKPSSTRRPAGGSGSG